MNESKVAIENVGPIEGTFEFSLDSPGLYELRGSSGSGKSTVLSALGLISGHKVDLTVHDGELSGQVTGLGVVSPVGSRKRRKGELEVDVLDSSKFDLADLIDPDGKTPGTRDMTRLKALAALSGLELKAEDLGVDPADVDPTTDPILLASRVKTFIEKQARALESEANKLTGEAKSKLEQTEGVDLKAESDWKVLSEAFEAATSTLQNLVTRRSEAESNTERIAQAAVTLKHIDDSGHNSEEIQAEIGALEKTIAEHEAALTRARDQLEAKQSAHRDRVALEKQVAELREIVEGDQVDSPTDDDIDKASQAKDAARQSMEEGVKIREALKAKDEAQSLTAKADELLKESEQLRAKSRSVYEEVARRLKLSDMHVETIDDDLRLVVQHPKRGKTLYDQKNGLSDGERVKFALKELVSKFHSESPGLLPIPQRVYQDLQPAARQELAKYAEKAGLFIVGAQVTDGPLEVEKVSA